MFQYKSNADRRKINSSIGSVTFIDIFIHEIFFKYLIYDIFLKVWYAALT